VDRLASVTFPLVERIIQPTSIWRHFDKTLRLLAINSSYVEAGYTETDLFVPRPRCLRLKRIASLNRVTAKRGLA
jgi:hypothetical protein